MTEPKTQSNSPLSQQEIAPEAVPKTRGEKFYDRFIGSSTYLITFGASLASAYFFKYHETGKRWLKPVSGGLENFFRKNTWLGGKHPDERARNVVEIGSLMAGGTTPVVPFKWIEDNRTNIINGYNEKFGSGIEDEALQAAAQERIDHIPKQSWSSTLKGRGAAMGATLALGIPSVTATPIDKAQLWLTRGLNTYASIGKRIRPKNADQAFTIDKYFVMDGTWSGLTSAVLLVASRLTSRADAKRNEHTIEKEQPPVAETFTQPVKAETAELSDVEHQGRVESEAALQR
jgi:hypothetical protein